MWITSTGCTVWRRRDTRRQSNHCLYWPRCLTTIQAGILVMCDGVKSEYCSHVRCTSRDSLRTVTDMPSVVDPGTTVRLFADDTLIYRVIRSIEDQVALQGDLVRLEKWAKSWGMVFNASKCYMMHISRPSSSEQFMGKSTPTEHPYTFTLREWR